MECLYFYKFFDDIFPSIGGGGGGVESGCSAGWTTYPKKPICNVFKFIMHLRFSYVNTNEVLFLKNFYLI